MKPRSRIGWPGGQIAQPGSCSGGGAPLSWYMYAITSQVNINVAADGRLVRGWLRDDA